ncbi:MAG: thiosulfate oxidation carrier complex protein SoxZ [Gammaproteobacteria bacterium]
MASQIKIRATLESGVTTVKTLMIHPMETGLFKDKKTGEPIPAHFIQAVRCEHNGNVVLDAECGIAISKNPYLAFSFDGGAVGDTIKVSWTDNRGASESAETTIN